MQVQSLIGLSWISNQMTFQHVQSSFHWYEKQQQQFNVRLAVNRSRIKHMAQNYDSNTTDH